MSLDLFSGFMLFYIYTKTYVRFQVLISACMKMDIFNAMFVHLPKYTIS